MTRVHHIKWTYRGDFNAADSSLGNKLIDISNNCNIHVGNIVLLVYLQVLLWTLCM